MLALINRSHPSARELRSFWPTRPPYIYPGYSSDIVGGQHLTWEASGGYPRLLPANLGITSGPGRGPSHFSIALNGTNTRLSRAGFHWWTASGQITPCTVACWMRTSSGVQIIGDTAFRIYHFGGTLRYALYSTDYDSGVNAADDKWHHVALTHDNVNTGKLYLDGQVVHTSSPGGFTSSYTNFYLGYDQLWTNSFTGSIADPMFWRTALLPAEMWEVYKDACTGFAGLLSDGYVPVRASYHSGAPATGIAGGVPARHRARWAEPEAAVVSPANRRRRVFLGAGLPAVGTAPPRRQRRWIDSEERVSCPSRHGTMAAVYAGTVEVIEQSVLFDEAPSTAGGPLLASRYRR